MEVHLIISNIGEQMDDSEALLVANLCSTLSNSLQELTVWTYKATSAMLSSFVPVIVRCTLLHALTLYCMSSKHPPFPSSPFLLSLLSSPSIK